MNCLILVAKAGKTTYSMLGNSIHLLTDSNAKILGILVNAVLTQDQSYYKYYSSYIDEATKPEVTTQA